MTRYQRLFEVRILHEYFLIGGSTYSYYDQPEAIRDSQLENRLTQGHYRLMQDLSIEPTDRCSKVLRNYRLKFFPTPTGFVIITGTQEKMVNGVNKVFPRLSIDELLELNFLIKIVNPQFINYTGLPLPKDSYTGYHLTNEATNVIDSEFISLSKPVADFQNGQQYLSGQIANHGGQLREATSDTTSNVPWIDVHGDGLVSESDRNALPPRFMYHPTEEEIGNPLTFNLKSADGMQEIKSINIPSGKLGGHPINLLSSWSSTSESIYLIDEGRYKLEKNNDLGTSERTIFLSPQYTSNHLGALTIAVDNDPKWLPVLGTDRELRQSHPIFEVRFRTRQSYWKYQAGLKGKNLIPRSGNHIYFEDDQGNDAAVDTPSSFFITKWPQKSALAPIKIAFGGTQEYFVQPKPQHLMPLRNIDNLSGSPGTLISQVPISSITGKLEVDN